MTQYVGTDGNLYQNMLHLVQIFFVSVKSIKRDMIHPIILLKQCIEYYGSKYQSVRYIKDGIAIVMYTVTGTNGGYVCFRLKHQISNKVNNRSGN
jgi:hypothetical protein